MPTTIRHTLANREFRPTRALRLIALSSVLSVAAACHDAPTAPHTHPSPTLNVSSDGTWIVNSLADPGDGTCSNNECTLREAIAAAQDGERVTFKDNISGRIALTAGRLVVDKSLTIEARDPSQIAVDGQGTTTVFAVAGATGGVLVNLFNLTITGGGGTPGSGVHVFFGSTLNVIGSVVTGNNALGNGGGINASNATLRVARSTVAGNTATGVGGGIYVRDDNLTVSRSTISGNSAASGGGIYLECSGSASCATNGMTIRSSTITQNDTQIAGGGGIATLASTNTFSNTIVAGNRRTGFADAASADCSFALGPAVSFGYNLTSPGTGCDLTSPTDIVLQSIEQVFTAVLSPALADNGSSRPTHALVERGFAVDAGYCPGESTDERDRPRPFDDLRMPNALDGCDIGAFEWNPPAAKPKPKP